MNMYEAIAFMSSSGMNREQITDVIHAIIDESLYYGGKEARWYAHCNLHDFYNSKEREEQNNETNK